MSTILGTARPWNFAAIAANAGSAGVEVGYNANKTDGSNAGGTGTQNQGFTFGQQHTSPAGETGPYTVAVNPSDFVFVKYNSGTVNPGSGAVGPSGGASPTIDYADANGYVYPTDCMPLTKDIYGIAPVIGKGGLCGVFTDGSGNIIAGSFWSFRTFTYSVSAAATASGGYTVYTGVFPLNLLGHTITIAGFVTYTSNNGTFTCSANTPTTITLNNASGVVETCATTATIATTDLPNVLFAPDTAAYLSLGINDSILQNNTGSFDVTVTPVSVGSVAQRGDRPIFPRYPIGLVSCGQLGDVMQDSVYLVQGFTPIDMPGELLKSYVGQLFPRGAQNYGAGYNGQNFPY